ncbi:glucan endo-1,3-beta-glucosidase-like [Magnolia sinica]|uniref:glucan endo-1,3-beta-glucosidase-like n=1 Tax=Magnolia sinica TaxID=86752 RepID=UPI0026581912|nr:glucan endo-1,3-beta-glucosidase-like [Magnolia sinica]
MALFSILSLLFLSLLRPSTSIGVNYGTLADNLPPATQVASFLKQHTFIDAIKIFNADHAIIGAFANTNIAVTVTVPNGEIPALSKIRRARAWVAANIVPFFPATKITCIAVGNEIIYSGDKNLIVNLLPAMKNIHHALKRAGITTIKVSTPNTLGFLAASDPPSTGRFKDAYERVILSPMLAFLRETKSPFMINPYPYFAFYDKTLNYAIFKPNPGKFDAATGIKYTSMFDAMLDAVYTAMKRIGYGDVEIVVAETGWPSIGDPNQMGVSVENAASYNGNLIRHVTSGKGTPLMPGRKFETYVFSLFNENLKPGSTAERNFGLFKPDLTPVYDVGIMRGQSGGPAPTPTTPSGSAHKWCVAKQGISAQSLQSNIDYVCSSGIDCKPIQAGGPCFLPNTIQAHASYVMNAYYQSKGRNNFNCDFSNTGVITTSNPSSGSCKYSF